MQTEIEKADAMKVDQAIDYIQKGNIKEAELILLDVCSRCPNDYQYEYMSDGSRYIKFWSLMEFMEFVSSEGKDNKQSLMWVPSAYPRACFNLAYILVDKRNLDGALLWLKKGMAMEPQNPNFLLEMGVVYAHMKESQLAFDCYKEALDLTSLSKQKHAVALRGMGVQLIDLQRLDEAEKHLKDSLKFEPDNKIVKAELLHISQLRSGKRPRKKKSWLKFWE